MGIHVGFIQNLIGPRGQRCVDGRWCGRGCGCEGCVKEDWLAAELKGFIDQVPSCSPDCWGRVAAAVGPRVVAPSGGGLGPPRVDVYFTLRRAYTILSCTCSLA